MQNRKLLLLIILALSTLSSFAQNTKYQSRFWKISMEGKPDSYLYGTMHVSDKIAFNLSDSFYKALQSVDVVGLESNPAEWLDSFNTFENAFSFSGIPRFNMSASKGFYQNSMVFRKVENDDIASLLKTRSSILNSMLYRESSGNKEYQEDTWLEMHIYQTASKNNIPVVSLEGFTQSRDFVTRASYEESNNNTKRIVPKWLEDVLKEKNQYTLLEDAYRKGDLDMIDTLNRVFNSPGYYKYMLTERNRNQVDNFMKYNATGSVFMAVGASHLAGSDGVIEMLRAHGYKVTPIMDARTDYAKKEKDRLDSIVAPVSYVQTNAPNGTFSMLWPEKLHSSTSGYTNATIGYVLSNGVYFINHQMNTYAPFYGQTQEQMLQKTDSLLFENIPGDIKSKKRVITEGIPGIVVKNVTRTGDHEQYRIYATPFQLSMFKLSGRKDRIDQMGDSIFNAMQLRPLSSKWTTHKFVSGQFEVHVPEYRVMNIIDPIQTMYVNPYLQAFDNGDKSYYLLKRVSVHDYKYIEEVDFEMKRFAEKLIKKMDYETIRIQNKKYNGLPAADFTAKTASNQYVHGRFVMHQQFYYFLICINDKKKFGPDKFFNSLTFTEATKSLPTELFMDTIMKATVLASPLLNKRYLLERDYKYGVEKEAYKSTFKSKNYYTENDELIYVERKVFGKYDSYEHIDSLWKEMTEDDKIKDPFFIVKQKAYKKDGLHVLDVLLLDTGSIKSIVKRYILSKNEDVLFTLSYLTDTISGTNAYTKSFFEKFSPMDTLIRPSIFSNKARLIVQDYLLEDKELHKDVLSYINGYTFYRRPKLQKTDLELIETALFLNPHADKEPFMKTIFIKMLGEIESDSAADLLGKIYKTHEDDYPVQIACMTSLARLKKEKASKILQEILENDQPFISSNDIFIFYSIIKDSSRLKNQMYLTLLEKMPDVYKGNIYNVLSSVATDTASKVKIDYEVLLDDILKRYRFELKKSKVNEQIETLEKSKKESSGRNNSYGNYHYSSAGNYSSGANLYSYYRLLLPYDSMENVKAYLAESDELMAYENISEIQKDRLAFKKDINPEKVKELFKEKEKLLSAYQFLLDINRTDLLPDTLKDKERFTKYCLNWRRNVYDLDKDTIKLIKTEMVDSKDGKMELYYYQINEFKDPKKTPAYRMNDPSYKLVCAGFLVNAKGFYPTKYDFSEYTSIDSEEKVKDAMELLKESAEIYGRKRAKPSKGGGNYYGY